MLAAWQIWVIAGLLLWILEIFTPGFVVAVFGVACLVAAPFAALGFSLTTQVIIFAISGGVLALTVRPVLLRLLYRKPGGYQSNVQGIIGSMGVVTEAIDTPAGRGRVKVGGEEWRAVDENEARISEGSNVMVLAIRGSTAIVMAVESDTWGKS